MKPEQLYQHLKELGEKFDINEGDFWLVSGQEAPRSTFGHVIGLNISQLIQNVTNYDSDSSGYSSFQHW